MNNIIAFNQAFTGTAGGGFGRRAYVHVGSDPRVRYNDLNGNLPNNVDGSKTDASYIGLNGNVSLNPDFVSRVTGSRDYHLKSTSPVIDIGANADGSAEDFDGIPRPLPGPANGPAIVDMGAFEFYTDNDGDGIPDALDPDDDNDGVLDGSDNCPFAANPTRPITTATRSATPATPTTTTTASTTPPTTARSSPTRPRPTVTATPSATPATPARPTGQ